MKARILHGLFFVFVFVGSCGGRVVPTTTPCSNVVNRTTFESGGLKLEAESVTTYPEINISSSTEACGAELTRSERTLLIIFYRAFGATGAFALNKSGVTASLRHFPKDALATRPDKDIAAVDGSVVITRFRTTPSIRVTGSYDLTFPDGARITGTFDSPWCNRENSCPGWNQP